MKCKSNTNAGLWQVRVIEIKACMLQLMDLYPVAITNACSRAFCSLRAQNAADARRYVASTQTALAI